MDTEKLDALDRSGLKQGGWRKLLQAPADPQLFAEPDEKIWSVVAHLSALLGAAITIGWGVGLGCVVGPFFVWQIKKERMPFVADQAKEALNFNITLAIVELFFGLLFWIGLGFVVKLMALAGIAWFVLIVIAAVKSNEGYAYRYPFALRLVK